MKKKTIIAIIIALLLVNSAIIITAFRVHNENSSELKQDVDFVSGSAGIASEKLKAERESQRESDDFITTAIGNNINSPKSKSGAVRTAASSKENGSDTKGNKKKGKSGTSKDSSPSGSSSDHGGSGSLSENMISNVVPEDAGDKEKIPFDIAEPELFDSGEVEYADNQILIKFKKTFNGKTDNELKTAGIGKLEPMFETETGNWYVAYLYKKSDVNESLKAVREIKNVVTAEYNFKSEPASIDTEILMDEVTSNDRAHDQWSVRSSGVQGAWHYLKQNGISPGGSRNVTVAVIDTGVDYTHKDLDGNIWTNSDEIPDNDIDDDNNGYIDDYYGIDMTAGRGSGMDDHGHGTHVAGIVAAENNNFGIVGIAYNTKVMPVKAGDASGYFLQSNIAEAIIYAYNEGADVINMSFGGGASSVAVRDALETAYSRCVLVAAAGNAGYPNESTDYYPIPMPNFPGDYKFVLGVMASDSNDMECSFSNWDARRFNNNEYEVYAPGQGILSTIPGDRYASLSGTSMASPVVAAQAALIRSMYNDMDRYPTKFVYGQISGTSDETVRCCNPSRHTVGGDPHNLPGRINFENSLRQMPNPEVSLSDYTLFDSAGFESDTEGVASEAANVNNGDGIVDSGEIIALGFTLRNRWGMSRDSIVSIDATNDLGVANPYVTLLNNDINYGSVGTYSEQDAGRIMNGDEWTGWENPFYLKIADNCPNDYTISLNINVQSRNGLDESDRTVYQSGASLTLTVRNGVILPNKITEDMTLSSNNYYIIPNSTIIMEGATVTVEPGTKIQFWSDDPNDAYADVAIAYLKVQGQLLCEGTEEAPIDIFPSDWMGQYRVEIYESDNGYVSMEHTNISNPYINISKAANCTFKQINANTNTYCRYLDGGNVFINNWEGGLINIGKARECVFYKLGGSASYTKTSVEGYTYDTCSFVDSALELSRDTTFRNCVFYGNNDIADGSQGGNVSSYTAKVQNSSFSPEQVIYEPDTDKYYVAIYHDVFRYLRSIIIDTYVNDWNSQYNSFASYMNGSLACINTKDEYSYLINNLNHYDNYSDYWFGLHKGRNSAVLNYDDSIVPDTVPVEAGAMAYGCMNKGTATFAKSDNACANYSLIEIPGNGLATDIKLGEYVVNLETGSTHQIEASVKPVTVSQSDLQFESEDQSVATVDNEGVITALAPGTTQIRVYSQDLAVYNYVTVNVTDYVAIEGLDAAEDEVQINIGDTKRIRPVFTPENTTRKTVTYTSSNDSIATVSPKGVVTANAEGDAAITLTGENGLETTVAVHVVIPVESIAFSKDIYETNIDGSADAIVTEPEILPAEATNKSLLWESTDPSICNVEGGELVKRNTGIATLRATVENTNLSDEITVIVTDAEVKPVAVKTVKSDGIYTYAITEEGEIFVWGREITSPVRMAYENVEDACINYSGSSAFILDKDGNVTKYSWSITDPVRDESFGMLKKISSLSSSNYITNSYHAIDSSGSVWAWGYNDYGQLGDGGNASREKPVQVEIEKSILKTLDIGATTAYLDEDGTVYISGSNNRYKTPKALSSGAEDIYSQGYSDFFSVDYQTKTTCYASWDMSACGTWNKTRNGVLSIRYPEVQWYIDNGVPYVRGNNSSGQLGTGRSNGESVSNEYVSEFTPMENVASAKDIIAFQNGYTFVITEDGALYGTGYNANAELGIGINGNVAIPTPIEFLSSDYSDEMLAVTDWNGSSGTVTSDGTIELTFNMAPKAGSDYSLITLTDVDGNNLGISKKLDMNKLTVKAKADMTDGETYTLNVPQNALMSRLNGGMSEGLSLSFEYHKSGSGSPTEEEAEDEESEEAEDVEEIHDIVTDEEKLSQRKKITTETLQADWEEYCGLNINANFYSNVILNRINDDETSTWLRITAPNSDSYKTISLGHNYWGTTNKKLINKQILDFDDYQSLADIDESQYLTEAPSNTFPFVTEAYLTVNGGKVDTVGNDEVTFVVDFNRAMDTSIDLDVKFGSSYPYADYTINGEYVSPTEWQGTVKLNTLIENGYQYFSISNGKAAGTSLKLYKDWGRFPFRIDTSSAQSLLMQGNATADGIELTWSQDDFETLAGYNVYRSTAEDGLYQKVNTTVIPADTREFLDDTVEPGARYFYNFTVVQSDMSESEPSGKVDITALDTMAPNIYHTPVVTAYKGSNLVISATILDNVGIENAKLYYRVSGSEEWKSRIMDRNNDKFSAVVNSSFITDDGLEYYIEAFDGNEYTRKGSAEEPFVVMVQEPVTASDLGDVDGNGAVELKDALMLLMAVNDRLNLTEEEFNRADLDGNGELSAKEALRIINYINGTISSLR